MGWTTVRVPTTERLIDHLTKDSEYKVGDKKVQNTYMKHHYDERTSVLWKVRKQTVIGETTEEKYAILCDIIEGFSYKDLGEAMHPYYYSCPLEFLEMVPVECQEWRDGVIEYHKQQAA